MSNCAISSRRAPPFPSQAPHTQGQCQILPGTRCRVKRAGVLWPVLSWADDAVGSRLDVRRWFAAFERGAGCGDRGEAARIEQLEKLVGEPAARPTKDSSNVSDCAASSEPYLTVGRYGWNIDRHWTMTEQPRRAIAIHQCCRGRRRPGPLEGPIMTDTADRWLRAHGCSGRAEPAPGVPPARRRLPHGVLVAAPVAARIRARVRSLLPGSARPARRTGGRPDPQHGRRDRRSRPVLTTEDLDPVVAARCRSGAPAG